MKKAVILIFYEKVINMKIITENKVEMEFWVRDHNIFINYLCLQLL